jgi:hypothetical protein
LSVSIGSRKGLTMPSAAAADVIRQALAAGKVDELVISTAPVILAAESGASRRPPGKGGIARGETPQVLTVASS